VRPLLLVLILITFLNAAQPNPSTGHLVALGGHKLFIDCTNHPSAITVILESGAGDTHNGWSQVQPKVAEFASVCSYDRPGLGQSDKSTQPETPDSIAATLHQLLAAEGKTGPYILVGASLGGIYVRRFTSQHPDSVLGMVLVDSSHEEQYSHYFAISPSIAERFATQDGRFEKTESLQRSGQLPIGERLAWHYDIPLIVLEHKRFIPLPNQTPREEDRLAMDWHALQVDLASRSKYGRLREVNSGHVIAREQPDIVVESIRDIFERTKLQKTGE
jgi:pimeloyl-ACP methyl ester carboxylesterase